MPEVLRFADDLRPVLDKSRYLVLFTWRDTPLQGLRCVAELIGCECSLTATAAMQPNSQKQLEKQLVEMEARLMKEFKAANTGGCKCAIA